MKKFCIFYDFFVKSNWLDNSGFVIRENMRCTGHKKQEIRGIHILTILPFLLSFYVKAVQSQFF